MNKSSCSRNTETYSKNKSKIRLTAPRLINSSAALLPTVSKTDMNSTIWKNQSQGTISETFFNKKQNLSLKNKIYKSRAPRGINRDTKIPTNWPNGRKRILAKREGKELQEDKIKTKVSQISSIF